MDRNEDNVYVNSIITIQLETGINLSAVAGNVYIDVKFPVGHAPATIRWTGVKNGTMVEYTTDNNDLDAPGKYYLQAILSAGGLTDDVPGDTALLIVKARYK